MREICTICLILALCPVLFARVGDPLSPAETSALTAMLGEAGLDSLSLKFEKDWDLSTRFKSASQMRVLQDPWCALESIRQWQYALSGLDEDAGVPDVMEQMLSDAWQLQDSDGIYTEAAKHYEGFFGAGIRSPKKFLKACERAYRDLLPWHQKAFAALDNAQRDSLTAFLYQACSEGEDTDAYKLFFAASGLPYLESLDLKEFAALFEAVDFDALREASLRWLALVDVIRAHAGDVDFPKRKTVILDTDLGRMVIGSRGGDRYLPDKNRRICLIIDPAGDDFYSMGLSASFGHPFMLALDLGGNDTWRNDTPGGLFGARGGFCYSLDASGDDLYQGGDFSFSAYLGTGIHIDSAGADIYQGGSFSQASALFGAYLLLDRDGNDSYSAASQSQALGSTYGIAVLADLGGSDNYHLGGKYYHAPLMPSDFRTLGQGMGFGFRPDYAGGTGILYDKAGNDRYLGGVYAQGVGYWYATGMLIDSGGNDVYNAVYYPQGSGIHLACGMLYDAAGDDAYYSRNGPGQGAGHDWAVGVFIDGAGNDAYSIPGGNGLGLTNSMGMFVDASGDDRYERHEAQNYGSANYSRGTGGIGLFLDAGGKDAYPDSLMRDNHTWQKGVYGIGRDAEINSVAIAAAEQASGMDAPPDSLAPIEDIFAAAAEWEVGSAIERVRAARRYLLARKDEAIPWVLENKMSSQSGLEYRALEALNNGAPEFSAQLYPFIDAADSLAAKNALSLIAAKGDTLLVERVQALLSQRKYVPACLSVLGAINSHSSYVILREWTSHPQERFRYIAARSLMQLKLPEARAALQAMAEDPSFLVRALVRNIPSQEP